MAYPYNPDDVRKNLGLGAGMNMGILRAPTALGGPSGPMLNLPNLKSPPPGGQAVTLPSPQPTQSFNPTNRLMYKSDYLKFLSNKDKTPAVMGYPDENGATSPNLMSSPASLPRRQNPMMGPNSVGTVGEPGVGVKLNPSPALQIGGTDRYGNPYQPMGPVPRYTPYEIIDMSSEEKARDYIGRISDDEAKKIDPRGKQGLLDYLVEALKKRKIPQPPRQYPWRQGAQAPERDWEAIMDFQNFVGMRSGRTRDINVDKALQNPGMADQSFGGSLTLKQVTPEMIATLKAEGYNVDQKDYMKNGKLGILKTGSGSAALNLYKTLKAKGYDLEVQPFRQVSYRFYD